MSGATQSLLLLFNYSNYVLRFSCVDLQIQLWCTSQHISSNYPASSNMRIFDFQQLSQRTLSMHDSKGSIIYKNPRNFFFSAWPESFKANLQVCSRRAEVKPWGWTWNSRGPPETRRTPSQHLAAILISQHHVWLTYILVWKSSWPEPFFIVFSSNSGKTFCPASFCWCCLFLFDNWTD